ncbi:pentapeptide repeat-containing protein [Streptomyces sp. NPDC001852]|uniref:pentapeptide repeat-containing protein n=1 Tax=Streptomyces sp. NPDC001852 TaxID=3364619 RepID=UPI003679F2C3
MPSAESPESSSPASRGVMRWSLGRHVAVVLVVAVAAVVVVLGLLWLVLGAPRIRVIGVLGPADTYDAIKIALTVVAGSGGVVALVVAYRRQQLGETAEAREHDKTRTERFGAAAEQLAANQPAVRMAGASAMARLADEWLQERQMCIDVLCGYLRMPHAPDPPSDEEALRVWQCEREVRLTILRLIAAHLRDDSVQSWQGYDLDFTGAVLDEADFRRARFTGGEIIFIKALFVGHGHDQIVFDEAEFAEGAHVYFRLAEFRGGTLRFNRAKFNGGWVTFDSACFADAQVIFRDAAFTAGEILFEAAEFRGGRVDFTGAAFAGGIVNFGEHRLPSIYSTAPPAQFTGGIVDFAQAADFSHPPHFGLQEAPPGLRLPVGVDIADLP